MANSASACPHGLYFEDLLGTTSPIDPKQAQQRCECDQIYSRHPRRPSPYTVSKPFPELDEAIGRLEKVLRSFSDTDCVDDVLELRRPFRGSPKRIFVRQCYRDLVDRIANFAHRDDPVQIVVAGPSGVGKSQFVIFALCKLLGLFSMVVFDDGHLRFAYAAGQIRLLNRSECAALCVTRSETLYVADSCPAPYPAPSCTALIVANLDHQLELVGNRKTTLVLDMAAWTYDEFVLANSRLKVRTPADLQRFFATFGGNPSYVLSGISLNQAVALHTSPT